MRHGRSIMPFGKWRGTRIRLIPDDYLSWLSAWKGFQDPRWRWLHDSLIAELKFRGLRSDLADTPDPEPIEIPVEPPTKARRCIAL